MKLFHSWKRWQHKDERQNGCQNDAHQRDELPALP